MDPEVLAKLVAYEAGDIQNEEFLQLVQDHFCAKHICRLEEWPRTSPAPSSGSTTSSTT